MVLGLLATLTLPPASAAQGAKKEAAVKPPATGAKPAATTVKPEPTKAETPASTEKKAVGPKESTPAKAATVKPAEMPKPAKAEVRPAAPVGKTPEKADASVAFFRDRMIPKLKIKISDSELNNLRQQPRSYARCDVVENETTTYQNVAIKLKGWAGSFRNVDDRPGLTLNFDKNIKDQEFHDLDKIHLNNAVQDPTYLNEALATEMFQAAGIPAARVTHARVWINNRDLGVYVLVEGFGKEFLKRNNLDPKGNLYEGGFTQDINGKVELDSGETKADGSDVKAVIAACQEGDPVKRRAALERVVDIRKFIDYVALELLTCHWDGYVRNRNNYRFYFDPKTGKLQFFPHGMDQMFNNPGESVMQPGGAMVAQAVFSDPEWKLAYRERIMELVHLFTPAERMVSRVERIAKKLRPVFAEINQGPNFENQVNAVKQRVTQRAQSLIQQDSTFEPRPLRFALDGTAVVTGWKPLAETSDSVLEQREVRNGKETTDVLAISAGPGGRCVAAWRSRVLLLPGKYRLEAKARTKNVKALQEGAGAGAGVRINRTPRTNLLDATAAWTPLSHEFQIQGPMQEVELIAELVAASGWVEFDTGSMMLVRVR